MIDELIAVEIVVTGGPLKSVTVVESGPVLIEVVELRRVRTWDYAKR